MDSHRRVGDKFRARLWFGDGFTHHGTSHGYGLTGTNVGYLIIGRSGETSGTIPGKQSGILCWKFGVLRDTHRHPAGTDRTNGYATRSWICCDSGRKPLGDTDREELEPPLGE